MNNSDSFGKVVKQCKTEVTFKLQGQEKAPLQEKVLPIGILFSGVGSAIMSILSIGHGPLSRITWTRRARTPKFGCHQILRKKEVT